MSQIIICDNIRLMKIQNKIKNIIFVLGLFCALFLAGPVKAVLLNDLVNFNINQAHDASARSQVSTQLVKITPKLYFYVEKTWWNQQVLAKQNEILANLDKLSLEFENKIYPTLTSVFGSEWNPGVDGDERITLLFHQMKQDSGGYFRSADEYIKAQLPDSNEREMIYLPIEQIDNFQLKVFLAHEFVHLLTFNQKDKFYDLEEDVWLNEGRAEYAPTILGYDDNYEGSNLQRRVRAFLEKPVDSLSAWQDNKYDYGTVNVFLHYLVDHYGVNILVDSLKSKYTGIDSINYALQKSGTNENFSQIFTNWTIATIINDCSQNKNYCYLNSNLKNLKLSPTINFLPLSGNSSLSVTNLAKNWSSSWQKIIGGSGNLKLNFQSLSGLNFQIPYITFDKDGKYSVKFMKLDKDQKGQINILNFGQDVTSLIIIPSLQTDGINFSSQDATYPYTFTVSTESTEIIPAEDPVLIQKLLNQIDFLKKEIAKILAQKNGGVLPQNLACSQLTYDFGFGSVGDNVRCLQGFLKQQGTQIYPEGFVTGNFGNLTKLAVIRFQEKYKAEILAPSGLLTGNGFVGPRTRQKINQLLTK